MGKRFVGMLTGPRFKLDGIKLSWESVKNVLETQPTVDIRISNNAKPVGKTVRFYVEREFLFCEFELDQPVVFVTESTLVPDFEYTMGWDANKAPIAEHGILKAVYITIRPAMNKTLIKKI